jgi:hypothetical protein
MKCSKDLFLMGKNMIRRTNFLVVQGQKSGTFKKKSQKTFGLAETPGAF